MAGAPLSGSNWYEVSEWPHLLVDGLIELTVSSHRLAHAGGAERRACGGVATRLGLLHWRGRVARDPSRLGVRACRSQSEGDHKNQEGDFGRPAEKTAIQKAGWHARDPIRDSQAAASPSAGRELATTPLRLNTARGQKGLVTPFIGPARQGLLPSEGTVMSRTAIHPWLPFCVLLTSVALAACDVEVRGDHTGRDADLDVRTPVGSLSVRADDALPNTGLPVYPGAEPLRDGDEGNRATVRIDTSLFGIAVAAAEFESPDPPSSVISFYRDALGKYGEVVECRGNVDFKGKNRRRRPVCDEVRSGSETQLVSGTEDNNRTVVVKARGTGSEFAVVTYRHPPPSLRPRGPSRRQRR